MKPPKRIGRPPKGKAPLAGNKELEDLLVFGETFEDPRTGQERHRFPSYRDLGRRYGVSNSAIAQFSKKKNCMQRRKEAQREIRRKTDQKVAEAIAVPRAKIIAIVNKFLLQFEEALEDGSVRCDTAADLNTLVRLRTFLEGGPDSRREFNVSVSLDTLQERHRHMLKAARESSAEERGELSHSQSQTLPEKPPTSFIEGRIQEVSDQSELSSGVPAGALLTQSPRAVYGFEPAVASRPPGVPAEPVVDYDSVEPHEGDSGPDGGAYASEAENLDSDW